MQFIENGLFADDLDGWSIRAEGSAAATLERNPGGWLSLQWTAAGDVQQLRGRLTFAELTPPAGTRLRIRFDVSTASYCNLGNVSIGQAADPFSGTVAYPSWNVPVFPEWSSFEAEVTIAHEGNPSLDLVLAFSGTPGIYLDNVSVELVHLPAPLAIPHGWTETASASPLSIPYPAPSIPGAPLAVPWDWTGSPPLEFALTSDLGPLITDDLQPLLLNP